MTHAPGRTLREAHPEALGVIDASAARMRTLLREWIAIPSVSGEERRVVERIASDARAMGLEVDLWTTSDRELADHAGELPPHRPFVDRPTLVITLRGGARGRSLIFNAHSDVVASGDRSAWTCDPWAGDDRNGDIVGRGACDDKGPLAAALWAMLALKESGRTLAGDVRLEVVPGEEDCVGLGTLSSVLRGHRSDAAIILEPTQGIPRCASRGGVRFRIGLRGRAVHGTMKWLGVDAIKFARIALDECDALQDRWNTRAADPLFAEYPYARPVTVDSIAGGQWQGMVCDRCDIAGYLELLPDDDLDQWCARFRDELGERLAGRGIGADRVQIEFVEQYLGHRTDPESSLCREIASSLAACDSVSSLAPIRWTGFNSGCEAGVRAALHRTPTVVWGPGSLEHAHAPDERVRFEDVRACAAAFTIVARAWCDGKDSA